MVSGMARFLPNPLPLRPASSADNNCFAALQNLVENLFHADYVQPVMLEDRDYMRQKSFEPQRLVTVAILIANVIAFILQNVAQYDFSSLRIDSYFALSVEGLKRGFVWQLLTFQFMHAGLWHLVFNCWAIYVFGRAIEETLGGKNS